MAEGSEAGYIIAIVVVALLILYAIWKSVYVVKEKEVIVIERFGSYDSTLRAGVHFIMPFVKRPKKYWYRYHLSDNLGHTVLHQKTGVYRIVTQNEVVDFPKTTVISRDNAALLIDAVLSYTIVNPKQMIYSVQNLPDVLNKLLQAQLRAVCGSLDVDQIIEESASLHVLTGMLDSEATRWGVKIQFVKVQKVEAPGLTDVLAKKKNADLQNKQIIIDAKGDKQTNMNEAEGYRDSVVKQAEGKMQEVLARARGEAQATINFANAEARSIKEIARAVPNEDPTRYLLGTKYLDALESIANSPDGTNLHLLPKEIALLKTAQGLGLNTALLGGDKKTQ